MVLLIIIDTQNVIVYVILSVAKNLSVGANCEMFRFAQHDKLSINNVIVYVILSVAKNLSVRGER